jgi:3-phenylpropionate/trans-cinnamate dioxygenase ferredoxin reductase subunit
MPDFELMIIGGGPAGLSAARGYRDADGGGRVAIVGDEPRMPYRRPPLTKGLLRGEITEAELPLEPEQWLQDRHVSLISGRAAALDPIAHEVTLSGGRRLTYGNCVIATGAEPRRPSIPGCDDPAVRVLRGLDDVRELQRRLTPNAEVIVIGSGFIGCEIAASLRNRGIPVSLIAEERLPNASRLGEPVGAEIARWLREAGVALTLGAAVSAIQRDGERLQVRVPGTTLSGSVVVMATGVAPRSELLLGSGLKLEHGAIPVDASMRTAIPNVLAAGDVAFAYNALAGRRLRVEHWGDALKHGEIAGRRVAGQAQTWEQVPGFWSTIGTHSLKYAAWGDGYDDSRFEPRADGGFVARYGRDGRIVGVLTHQADDAYERGQKLIAEAAPW